MTHPRHVLTLVAAVTAMAASPAAIAVTSSDPASAEDRGAPADEDAGPDDDAGIVIVTAIPSTFVELSGGANGSLAATGEARTTWRYGRSRGAPVDETTNRLRVSATGRSLDGLSMGFSVALLVPALRAGTYTAAGQPGVAAVWARRDRATTPDIEWDASARDAGPASFVVNVTSIAEASHSSERRGSVTVDVTDFRVHGTLDATLPCTHSVPSLRQSCHPETLHGTF
jgi:hypothetical protein